MSSSSNDFYGHLCWNRVLTDQSAVLSPSRTSSVPVNYQHNHAQAQLPPNGAQLSSLASLIRERGRMDPGFGPQTTSSQLTRLQIQPTTQQRPVHNADPLHILASLAERAPRVCTHQTVSVGGSQQRHHGYDVSREAPEPAAADMMPFSNHQLETKPIFPMVVTEPTSTALPTNASLESDKTVEDIGMRRTMGRIRYFNENLGSYGPWKDIFGGSVGDTESIITLNLSRGGMLRILCNILPQNKRKDLSRAMHDCKLYRQYSLSRNNDFMGFQEPRSHVLLSSRAKATLDNDEVSDNERHQPGYSYHGVNMKAHPIDLVPEVASYAEELATRYNLPRWDIGVDMIAYKDGGDSIGWHADDTQGESVVVCVVVDAPGEVRPLCIRPKRTKQLGHGDEEIQLFIAEGDGYDMDGYMQESYEHSLPKKLKNNSHRFVLIFRHGNTLFVPQDSGVSVLNNNSVGSNSGEEWNLVSAISKLRPKTCTTNFGHPTDVIVGECYSRRFLWTTFAHRSDQRGINGNRKDGSDSIVVSRQDFDVREEDGLSWLRYTSSRRQGGGALCMSFRTKKPVRVFRSSNLKFSSYRPATFEGGRTSYRYDGLYVVTHVWDSEGYKTDRDIPGGSCRFGVQFTFHLERLPQPQNLISTEDLFLKIQQSYCCGPHLPFTSPQPKNGEDILPALIQNMDKLLATASSTQQQSRQSNFQQPFAMINQGAVIELERCLCFISKNQLERTNNAVRKKEGRSLPTDIVDAVFASILECKSPPQLDFKIITTEGSNLSPPPFDYEEGIYALVDIDFPIPHALSDRLVGEETLKLMNGRWTIGGSQTLSSTNFPNFNFRKRSMCPKGTCSSSGKRGALYTLVGSTGKDWCGCRLVHVYHSSKLKEGGEASPQEKKCTSSISLPVMFHVKEAVYAYDKDKSGDVLYEALVIK